MIWDIPTEDIDPAKVGGYSIPAVAKYHGQVTAIDPSDAKSGAMVVDAKVLGSTVANQEGLNQRIFFNKTSKNPNDRDAQASLFKRALTFAIAVGLTTAGEIAQAKQAGQALRIKWELAVDRHFLFEVEPNDQSKYKRSVGWNMWPMDSPEAAGIPINHGAIAQQQSPGSQSDVFQKGEGF